MEKLREEYEETAEFIGINIGVNEKRERVLKYVKEMELKIRIVFDEEKRLVKTFNVISTPTAMIIDKHGVVSYRSSALPNDLNEYLDTKPLDEETADEEPADEEAKVAEHDDKEPTEEEPAEE